MEENERLGAQGLRVMATAERDFDPKKFDRLSGPAAARQRPHAPRPRRHRRPAAPGGEARDREGARRGHPGAHDHGRPRRHGRGDRPPAGHHRPRDHRQGIRGDGRCDGRPRDRHDRRHRPRRAGGQGPPRGHPQAQGPHRRDDRRRRERRAGPQEGRHRRGDGHHRHGGLEGGRGDDPHRRQLRDDRPGRGARPRAVRQPRPLHPLPDGPAVRVHRDVPRREPAVHRRGHPVPAAPDPVGQLHGDGLPRRRARLRQGA